MIFSVTGEQTGDSRGSGWRKRSGSGRGKTGGPGPRSRRRRRARLEGVSTEAVFELPRGRRCRGVGKCWAHRSPALATCRGYSRCYTVLSHLSSQQRREMENSSSEGFSHLFQIPQAESDGAGVPIQWVFQSGLVLLYSTLSLRNGTKKGGWIFMSSVPTPTWSQSAATRRGRKKGRQEGWTRTCGEES